MVDATIIDGSQPINSERASVVTFENGETRDARIQGFTITGGTGTKIGSITKGGGIYCPNASPYILKNVIINNIVSGSGGGIGGESGSELLLYENKIIGNFAYWGGGL